MKNRRGIETEPEPLWPLPCHRRLGPQPLPWPSLIPSLTLACMLVRHYEAFVTAVFPRGVCPGNQVYYEDGYCDVHFTADGTVYIYPVKVIRHDPPTHTTTFTDFTTISSRTCTHPDQLSRPHRRPCSPFKGGC
jgi:hypothetical protein